MILKYIGRVSFRRSEQTNAKELAKRANLQKGEVMCLVSFGGDQLCFVYYGFNGQVTHSERLRMNSGQKWTPDMLGEYAKEAGMGIANLKAFDAWHGKKINTQTKRS